jgi:hypothetical protein
MRGKLIATIVVSAAFFHPFAIWADVISEQLVQAGGAGTFALGQSFTTPAGGPWNNLTFNWFDTGGAPNSGVPNPIATGTLFLLNQQYLGTPGALSAATPGYIAQSQNIALGMYLFSGNVIAQPNTTYFAYTNQTVPNNSGDGDVIAGSAYGDIGTGGTYTLLPGNIDARFRLQGNLIPEPSGMLLAASGLAAGLPGRRRAIRKGLRK